MNDKPEMPDEERAKLKAELLAELKAELKQDAGQSEPEKPDETSTPTTKAPPGKVESEPVNNQAELDNQWTWRKLTLYVWVLVPGIALAYTNPFFGLLWIFIWNEVFKGKF